MLIAKGLPPLPEPTGGQDSIEKGGDSDAKPPPELRASSKTQGLSFSSGSAAAKGKNAKRKAVGDGRDEDKKVEVAVKSTKKKAKKQEKKLLSFDEDA